MDVKPAANLTSTLSSTLTIFLVVFLLAACSKKTAPTITPDATIETKAPAATPTRQNAAEAEESPTPKPPASPNPTPEIKPPKEPFLGITVDEMHRTETASLFHDSGAAWSRWDYMHWDQIEPVNTGPNGYQWGSVREDNLLAATEAGYQTIANVLYAPPWAQKYPGVACGPIAEDALNDFSEFMGALVSKYSQPPYNVHYWEIGNEPDIDRSLVDAKSFYGCWGEIGDPYYGGEAYGEMLKVIYPIVKAADPEARVVVGGLVLDCDPINPPETSQNSGELRDCTASKFLQGILEAGAGLSFDAVSFHAYDYYYGDLGLYGNEGWHSISAENGPVLAAKARYVKALLSQYGLSDKELLNTESAVLCGKDGREPVCQEKAFMDTKSAYVAQANAAALAEGLNLNIWYSLNGWRGSGLIDAKLQPTSAYRAYQFSASLLTGAEYQGEISEYEGIRGYQFEQKGKKIWLVWSRDLEAHQMLLPSAPDVIYDIYGDELTANAGDLNELIASAAPLYLVWTE